MGASDTKITSNSNNQPPVLSIDNFYSDLQWMDEMDVLVLPAVKKLQEY